jgi:natural resistance-associated macrophage protein
MAGIQQQQLVNDTLPASWDGSSKRTAAVNVEGHPRPYIDHELKDPSHQVIYLCLEKKMFKLISN